MAQGQGVTCRTCGYTSPHGTPTCGNCAADLRSQPPHGRPLAAPRSGARRLVAVLLLLGVLGGGLSAAAEAIGDAVDWFDDATRVGDPPGAEVAAPATIEAVADGFASVPAVARAVRAGGLPCGRVKVDSADDSVATGSCQSRGAHVQISVYLTPATIDFARTKLFDDEWPFAFAHAHNWWVSSEPRVVRRVARILGGRVHVPR
ncbi:MAG TPA: hypothetical protein VHJ34_10575 [Actinomycetota bacterium]|nr:hypothetical protein [Actinomycetota bacterium]